MEVSLSVDWEVVVDDEGNLLDVNSTSQNVGSDEDTGAAGSELGHNESAFLLGHFTVLAGGLARTFMVNNEQPYQAGNREITSVHFFLQPLDLALRVAENDTLRDGKHVENLAESIKLPLLLVDSDVKLFDSLQSKLCLFNEDPYRVAHELFGKFEDVGRKCGREESNLDIRGNELKNAINGISKSLVEHAVRFVHEEHLELISTESTAVKHVPDTTGGANDDLDTVAESLNVVADITSTNAGTRGDTHIVAECNDDFVDLVSEFPGRGEDDGLGCMEREVEPLEDGDGECSCFAGAGLSLSDRVEALGNGDDGLALDSRGTFESGCV